MNCTTQPETAITIISGTGNKLRTSNLAGTFTGPSEQKPITHLGEKGAWAYPGTAQIFEYPYYIPNGVKLRISNFVRTFTGSIETKPINNFGKK